MSSSNADEVLWEDPRSMPACLLGFQLAIIERLKDILGRKFDSLMKVFNGKNSFDSTVHDELKEKFITSIMPLLMPKWADLLKDPELEVRVKAAEQKRKYNYTSEEPNAVAVLLKPYKSESLARHGQIKAHVESLKKAEEQILESMQSELAEVLEREKAVKKKTLVSIVPLSEAADLVHCANIPLLDI